MSYNAKAQRSYRSRQNNAQGGLFEEQIDNACEYYKINGIAEIEKTPEPFKVLKKLDGGRFLGIFNTREAQPDYKGTMAGGRAVVFEAKFTTTDSIKKSVVSAGQVKRLDKHAALGAKTGVCVGIKDKSYFVPWGVWQNMKSIYGHQFLTQDDIEQYEVKYGMMIMFLDYKNQKEDKQ